MRQLLSLMEARKNRLTAPSRLHQTRAAQSSGLPHTSALRTQQHRSITSLLHSNHSCSYETLLYLILRSISIPFSISNLLCWFGELPKKPFGFISPSTASIVHDEPPILQNTTNSKHQSEIITNLLSDPIPKHYLIIRLLFHSSMSSSRLSKLWSYGSASGSSSGSWYCAKYEWAKASEAVIRVSVSKTSIFSSRSTAGRQHRQRGIKRKTFRMLYKAVQILYSISKQT